MKNTLLALAPAVVVGALTGLAYWGGPFPPSAIEIPEGGRAEAPASSAGRGTAGEELTPPPTAPRAPVSGARKIEPTEPRAGAAERELGGRVRAIDGSGRAVPVGSGRFQLVYADGASRRRERVEVVDGRWRAPRHPARTLEASGFLLDGRGGLGLDVCLDPGSSAPQEIGVRLADPASLLVLERGTRRHLDGIEICPGSLTGALPGRAPQHALARGASSPVDLDELVRRAPTASSMAYWVRADGFAWSRVVIDHGRGGARTVTLEPGALLAIDAPAELRGVGAVLRVRRGGEEGDPTTLAAGETYLELRPTPDGPLMVAGLPLGAYTLEMTAASPTGSALVARGTARVDGPRASTRLTLVGGPGGPAELHGSLAIPATWGAGADALVLEPLAGDRGSKDRVRLPIASMTSAGSGRYRWSAGLRAPGPYRARLERAGFSELLELGVESAPHHLVVGEPASVTVQVRSRGRATAPDSLFLRWRTPTGEGPARRVDLSGWEARFLAPVGPLEIELVELGSLRPLARKTLTSCRGPVTAVLELAALCELRLDLRDAEGPLAWDEARWRLRVTDLTTGRVIEGAADRLLLPAGHAFEVHVLGSPDHLPVAPITVDLPPDDVYELGVHLERRRDP
jgi:hypothetical protein